MASALHRRVAQAVRAGLDLDAIERTVIDPAEVDEEEKAALWLYAEVLWARRDESMLTSEDDSPIRA